ncbi:hypothetical protein MnTg02_00819 [bacterium MnTg02]|nr:hypothetical protein MnTg02_00819 [bacterium MnTg02]
MVRINRDVVVAVVLLLICGIFFWASFDIRQPDYGSLKPSTWPRAILAVLALLSLIYLAQSLKGGEDQAEIDDDKPRDVRGWFSYWRNIFWCFALFFAYLASIPMLGMLISGVLFVFLLLSVLGGWTWRNVILHAGVALLTVGGMWSLFTFGLGVLLPPGEILTPF